MLNPQIIKAIYKRGRREDMYSSSNIASNNQIKAMSIIMVNNPSVIISNGRDKTFKSGFKK